MNKKKIIKSIIGVVALLSAIWIFFEIQQFLKVDSCLDLGGTWNYETNKCEYSNITNNKLRPKKINLKEKVLSNPIPQPEKVKSETIKKSYQFDNEVKTLGIGLVQAPSNFLVYSDSTLNSEFLEYDMYSTEIGFYSKYHKPDYGIMHFVCIGMTSKFYKILINYSEVKYLPKSNNYKYSNWTDYIMSSFGVRRNQTQKLFDQPNFKGKELEVPAGYELFCPVDMKENWIKVKWDCFYNSENESYGEEPCSNYIDKCINNQTGWIIWKKGNEILIDIFLMP